VNDSEQTARIRELARQEAALSVQPCADEVNRLQKLVEQFARQQSDLEAVLQELLPDLHRKLEEVRNLEAARKTGMVADIRKILASHSAKERC
jgi:hypothetical protein